MITLGGWQDDATYKNGLLGSSTSLSVSGTTSSDESPHTHTFSGTTGAMNSNASHSHAGVVRPVGFSQGAGSYHGSEWTGNTGRTDQRDTQATNTDHTHSYSGTTSAGSANHSHTVTSTVVPSPFLQTVTQKRALKTKASMTLSNINC